MGFDTIEINQVFTIIETFQTPVSYGEAGKWNQEKIEG